MFGVVFLLSILIGLQLLGGVYCIKDWEWVGKRTK